jgi:hypothetical protein
VSLSVEPQTFDGCTLVNLVRLVAGSTVFQARIGVATTAEAEEFIFWPHIVTPEETEIRPYVVITQGDFTSQKIAGGQCNEMLPLGTLDLLFADDAKYLPNSHDSLIDFENFAGGVVRDITEVAGGTTNSIVTITRVGTHQLSDQTDLKPHWYGMYRIESNVIG